MSFFRKKESTSVYTAARNGDLPALQKYLAKDRSSLNCIDEVYGTPLQAAAAKANIKSIRHLLAANANPNTRGGDYCTPLQAALRFGPTRSTKKDRAVVVKALLAAGADPNNWGGERDAPLVSAAFLGVCVQDLLEAGAKVNAVSPDGHTALVVASSEGRIKDVKLLLDAGANPNHSGGDLGTALVAAAGHGQFEIMDLLLNSWADPNITGGFHEYPLLAAVGWECFQDYHDMSIAVTRIQMVRALLNAGADPTVSTAKFVKNTALEIAQQSGSLECVEMIAQAVEKWESTTISSEASGTSSGISS